MGTAPRPRQPAVPRPRPATLELALAANVLSLLLAVVVGLYRAKVRGVWRWPATIYVDTLRNLPVLVVLFVMRFGPPVLGVSLDSFTAALIGLTLYNSAHLAEIVRAGIDNVPAHQTDAARATGMKPAAVLWWVVSPQALRIMLPALISQFVILLQATSLATAINVVELTRTGQILFSRYGNPLEVFTLIAVVYFLVNYALSQLATTLHSRLSTTDRGAPRARLGGLVRIG